MSLKRHFKHSLSTIQSYHHAPLALYDRIMQVNFIHCIDGNVEINLQYFHATHGAPFQLCPQECIVAVSVCDLVSLFIGYPNYKKAQKRLHIYVAKEEMESL